MPRKPRLKRHPRGWTDEHRLVLQHGSDYFEVFGSDSQQAHTLKRKAWLELGKEILQDWIAEHPGSRPWGWWEFQTPQGGRRECLSGTHPHDDPQNDLPRESHFGTPRYLRPEDMEAQFETQREFLERLQQLRPSEVANLQPRKDAQ